MEYQEQRQMSAARVKSSCLSKSTLLEECMAQLGGGGYGLICILSRHCVARIPTGHSTSRQSVQHLVIPVPRRICFG